MPAALKVRSGNLVMVDSGLLDPESGCGLMLARNSHYEANDVFRDCMRRYGFWRLFADRAAQGILDEQENLMSIFCQNVDAGKAPLQLNFRTVYEKSNLILVLDKGKQAAHFIASAENRLALSNYYRDAMPGVAKSLGFSISGWPERLVVVGWQNLYDVTNDGHFTFDYPNLKAIDVTLGSPAIEWHGPVLELAVNTLNLSDPRTIRETIRVKADKIGDRGSGIGDQNQGTGIGDQGSGPRPPTPETRTLSSDTQHPTPDTPVAPDSSSGDSPGWPEVS